MAKTINGADDSVIVGQYCDISSAAAGGRVFGGILTAARRELLMKR